MRRPRIAIDRCRDIGNVLLRNAQGNQRAVIAKLLGVEERANAAQIPLAFQIIQTAEHMLLRRLKHFTQTRKRP